MRAVVETGTLAVFQSGHYCTELNSFLFISHIDMSTAIVPKSARDARSPVQSRQAWFGHNPRAFDHLSTILLSRP
jgi:hypothetical protein